MIVRSFRMESSAKSIDVLVAGGGMAGIFAALGASEKNLSVALIEPSNILGGQGTAGGVAGFCGDTHLVNRPFDQLIETLLKHDKIAPLNPLADRRPYDLEICGYFLQEMAIEAGIDVFLHSRVLETTTEDGRVTTVRVACSSDIIAFTPKFVIDATGDCVVVNRAGFPTFHDAENVQLPMSLYFTLWDTGTRVEPFLPPGCPTWSQDDDLPMTSLHVFETGKVEVKMKVVGYDAASGESLSKAELSARRQMMGLIYYLQTHGYQSRKLDRHVLSSVSRHIGQREGRRLVGEYVLTEDDVTHAATFEDAVAVGTYHLDYHWPDKVERAGTGITTMVEPYHIPLRSLVAKGSKNLMAVGRSVSGEQMAMSSFRVQATCAQTGFAAGRAARVCIEQDRDLQNPPVDEIQASIIAGKQSLNLSDYGTYLRHKIHNHEHIFEPGDAFESCHASTLIEVDNGRFLAAWFAGSREGHDDVGIWLSSRDRCKWSEPFQVARSRNKPHWNPVLFEDSGIACLIFKVSVDEPVTGERMRVYDGWETWWMRSEDQGKTWSEPAELVSGDRQGRGPVKDKPILLSNGDWLAGASIETADTWDVFVDRSPDKGKSWNSTENLQIDRNVFTGKGAIQPTLWESEPGMVHMLVRTTAGFIGRADSTDYGRTWTPLRPTDLPNNNSGLDVAKLDDGTLALICNPVSERVRTPLSLMLSSDNGTTWPRRLDIESGEGRYSYPAIIPTRVGMAITYTWNRQSIGFWTGSVEQVPEH
jgi:predicted neuraminidase